MRNYHQQTNKRMFDFALYYDWVAERLPDQAVLAEVGIANGASAIYLTEALLNREKQFTFYWIDSLEYGGQNQLQEVLSHLGAANLCGQVIIMPVDSLNASCRFPDHHFDFVFIDASHQYESTKADIRLWYHKIKDEGTLGGHDYFDNLQVKQAVDELIPAQVTRTDIPDRVFPPEKVLRAHRTTEGHGIWEVTKKWYIKLQSV